MHIQNRKHVFLIACIIMLSILASCCACAPHMIAHGCPLCHEECALCQIFALNDKIAFLSIVLLLCAAILFACLRVFPEAEKRSIFPATLVARFVQMND